MTLRDYLSKIDSDLLRRCFEEYLELEVTGILPSGEARLIEKWYRENNCVPECTLDYIRDSIYREMAMRFYDREGYCVKNTNT